MTFEQRIVAVGIALFAVHSGASYADASGVVAGHVRYIGTRHAGPPIAVPHALAVCGHVKEPQDLLVGGNHALANAVVSITVPGATKPAPINVEVDQTECEYVPHVQAAPQGSHLSFINNDATLHNVHARRDNLTLANLAMPLKGEKVAAPPSMLAHVGKVSLKCDAGHTWMSGFIYVFDHPFFAVTASDGSFKIGGLPPGTYDLRIDHETLGTSTRKVTVTAGGVAQTDIDLP